MTAHNSIYSALYELNNCLTDHDIDPSSVGIVLRRDDYIRLKDAVTLENPMDDWNKGYAFNYAGLWFLDGEAYVYAKARH